MTPKKVTKAEAVRRALSRGGWVPMGVLMLAGGWRYGARLRELRLRGFDHETRFNKRTHGYEYRRAERMNGGKP